MKRDTTRQAASQAPQSESPGPSNTRAPTPAGRNPPTPRVLQASVDALKIAFRAAVDDLGLCLLSSLVDASKDSTTYSVDGEPFELQQVKGHEMRFALSNASKTILVRADVSGFPIQVEFRALYLRTQPLAAAVDEAERIARHFAAGDIAEARVWRLDLCVDATGLTFDRNDEQSCVTKARNKVRFQAPERVYTRRRHSESVVTGFVIAPGNELMMRIYDKTEELFAVHGRDSEKTLTETATYRRSGWDSEPPVWRVEAQFRGSRLRSLGAGTPRELIGKLDSLWHYAVGSEAEPCSGWFRFVQRGSATRSERCETDLRWRVYQEARFEGSEPVERIEGSRGGVSPEQMAGDLLSFLGCRCRLPCTDRAPDIREQLREDMARAADDMLLSHTSLCERYLFRREVVRARFSFGREEN